ncbi:MAG TPA: hypothetical protein VGP70_21700 [Actinomadura sp.]|jgi:hypothetical protein|nr:hypothetical protein [Actinomadura sp.]
MHDQRENEPHGQQGTARPMGPAESAVRHAIAAYSRRLGLGDPDTDDGLQEPRPTTSPDRRLQRSSKAGSGTA